MAQAYRRRVLGVQGVGPGDVSKRIAAAAMAIHGRLTVSDLANADLPYAPPFSLAVDLLIAAAHVLENKMLGRMKGIERQVREQMGITRRVCLVAMELDKAAYIEIVTDRYSMPPMSKKMFELTRPKFGQSFTWDQWYSKYKNGVNIAARS